MSPAFFIWSVIITAVFIMVLMAMFDPAQGLGMPSLVVDELGNTWFSRLLVNLLGYCVILVPGFLIKRFVQRSGYLDSTDHGCTWRLMKTCFRNDDVDRLTYGAGVSTAAEPEPDRSTLQRMWLALFCFAGLQGSYLTWGILQEKIMTLDYPSGDGAVERFTDSQFLVFVNRILAFALAGLYVLATKQPTHRAPLSSYSYCSFTNIMSSWCQYEALKYVSFPTQVLAKASKIIPVMLMGKLVSRRSYEFYEYVSAVVISVGMTLFMLSSATGRDSSATITTLSGVVILAGYVAFDSFTSNWQSELFRRHHMSPTQMMCGVNLFSCLLTTASLLQQGSFITSFQFALRHHRFLFDIALLSLTSATGQLFIFFTISKFGAIVFVIMMTIRQGLAILLSCIIYHHAISATGVVGVVLVFVALFLRLYSDHRMRQLKRRQKTAGAAVKV